MCCGFFYVFKLEAQKKFDLKENCKEYHKIICVSVFLLSFMDGDCKSKITLDL